MQTVKTNGDGVNRFHALVLKDFHPASHRDFIDRIAYFFCSYLTDRVSYKVSLVETTETSKNIKRARRICNLANLAARMECKAFESIQKCRM